MGADPFSVVSKGKTAQEAFNAATSQARDEYGHRGYTGTIAEKQEFRVFVLPTGREAREYSEELIDGDGAVSDKWGPAGCIKLSGPDAAGVCTWLFFGWASS
jgi:hypothetical protein